MNTFYKRSNFHEPSLYDTFLSYNTFSAYTKFFDRGNYYYYRIDYCENGDIRCTDEQIYNLTRSTYLRIIKFHKYSKSISMSLFEIPHNIDWRKIYSVQFNNKEPSVMVMTNNISTTQLKLWRLDVFLHPIDKVAEGNIFIEEDNDDTLNYITVNDERLDININKYYHNYDKYSLVYNQSYGTNQGSIKIFKNNVKFIELFRKVITNPSLYFKNNIGILIFQERKAQSRFRLDNIKKYNYIEFCLDTGIILNEFKYTTKNIITSLDDSR